MASDSITQEARLHFLDYWRVIKSRWAFVCIIWLVVVLVATVVTFLQPRLYRAALRMKVERETTTIPVFNREQFPLYDPFFLQTQYEIIQSREILDRVIEQLKLQSVWGGPGGELQPTLAATRLRASMSVRRFRDTSLIELIVVDRDPELAARIANTAAEVFEKSRLEVKREETMKGINKLREELDAQWQRVEDAQATVERLRKELNVPMLGGGVRLPDIALTELNQQLTLAKVDAAGRESKLLELKKLNPLQLRNSIATLINDPNVGSLLQGVTESELRFEVLKQDYGPEHPNVRAELASLDKLREQLDARLEGIMRGIEVEYQVAKSRVDELQRQMDDAKAQNMLMESETFRPFRNGLMQEERETRLYDALNQQLQEERVQVELPRSPVEVVERAEAPLAPFSPRMTLNLVLGAVAGLILGVVIAFFFEFLDTSIKKVEDVEHYLRMAVLGVIPQGAGLLPRGEGSPADVEAYRMLRANLDFARGESGVNSYCALSAAPGEGKSQTTANLACVCAQHGARVLVVDCDMRRPTIHELFGLANRIGLADYLVDGKSLEEVTTPATVPNVFVIAAGSGSNSKAALPMLTSSRMNDLIHTVSRRYDVVLYDTPPVLGVSDAASLARDVGASFLVIQHRRYPRDMSRRAQQIVEQSGGKLLGVVVNNVKPDQAGTYFYYHHQYDDYLKAPEQRARTEAAAAPSKSTPPAPTTPTKPGKGSKSDEIEISERF